MGVGTIETVGERLGFGVLRRLAARLRRRAGDASLRLRGGALPILQTALAASLAWYLASTLLGHERPFFAAIAAVVSLGATVGRAGGRVVELVFGVACGLAVADLLVLGIGTGTAQIAVVVALAMAAAFAIGGGTLLVTEAGVSALLVVGLDPTTAGTTPERFFDGLVGCSVALAMRAVLPSSPREIVARAAHPIFGELAATLRETATAVRSGDLGMAEEALRKARELDARVGGLRDAIDAGYGTALISPPKRRDLGSLRYYATAADQLDLAVRNVRVLARAATAMVRNGATAPDALAETILDLARAVEALEAFVSDPEHPLDTRRLALTAARSATAVLGERNDLETSMLVGQVRSTAVDLLRASGMDDVEALDAFAEAVSDAHGGAGGERAAAGNPA